MNGPLSVIWNVLRQAPSPDRYDAVASSGSGQYLLAAGYYNYGVYYSHDFGKSWNSSTFPNQENFRLNISFENADTTYNGNMFMLSGGTHGKGGYAWNSDIYFSDDFGMTFNRSTSIVSYGQTCTAYNVATNFDGSYVLVSIFMYNNDIPEDQVSNQLSSNFGATFTSTPITSQFWMPVALSDSGQYQIMCSTVCYTSIDFGVSFTKTLTNATGAHTTNVIISGDGQYATFTGSDTQIFMSDTFGKTWLEMVPYLYSSYQGVACDSSGKRVIFGDSADSYMIMGLIEYTTTKAPTASTLSSATPTVPSSMIPSFVPSNNPSIVSTPVVVPSAVPTVVPSPTSATPSTVTPSMPTAAPSLDLQTLQWSQIEYSTLITSTSQFSGVGFDSSGQHMVLAAPSGTLITSNYGQSWGLAYTDGFPTFGVSVSSSGYYITYITNPDLCPFTNYGATPGGYAYQASYPLTFLAMDMSDSGVYQYAVGTGAFVVINMTTVAPYQPGRYIQQFFPVPVPLPAFYSAVACSGDGSRVYVAVSNSSDGGPLVFYSTNYALFTSLTYGSYVWTAAVDSSAYTNWIFMTCSDSGQYVAGINISHVYISSDYGVNYALVLTAVAGGLTFNSIAMSASGKNVFLSTSTDGILVSSQFGSLNTWADSAAPTTNSQGQRIQYGNIVSNPAGDIVTVVTRNNQGVYTTYDGTSTLKPTSLPVKSLTSAPTVTMRPTVIPSPSPSTRIPMATSSLYPTFGVPSAAPTVVGFTALPTVSNMIEFDASQIINGISFSTYMTNTTNYDRTLKAAIAVTMTGVEPSNLINWVVGTATSGRRLASEESSDIAISYTVSVNLPGQDWTGLSNQLSSAIVTGTFNAYLGGFAQQYDAPGLIGATSSAVTTSQVTPDSTSDSPSDSLSSGAIAGIVIGSMVAVAILFIAVAVHYRFKAAMSQSDEKSGFDMGDHQLAEMVISENPMSAKEASAPTAQS
eukprot:gene25804-32297_t